MGMDLHQWLEGKAQHHGHLFAVLLPGGEQGPVAGNGILQDVLCLQVLSPPNATRRTIHSCNVPSASHLGCLVQEFICCDQ